MKSVFFSVCLSLTMVTNLMSAEEAQTLFEFNRPNAAKEWKTVNDGVMGGVSEGKFKIADQRTLEFYGMLSLKNNGGFASVRTSGKNLALKSGDTLIIKVRGDGREYSFNLYVDKPLIAFSYRAMVQTKKDEWIEIRIPLDKFEATWFGRIVKGAGAVKPEEVNAVGFMLSDKQEGSFKLDVEWIKVAGADAE